MMSNKQQRGFTLFEIMLVIAVMAVMAMAGVQYMQAKARTAKVDRAALQMQQWLQAGMAYYVDHQEWPASEEVLIAGGYLPGNLTTNPWGGAYSPTFVPQARAFTVTTTVPTESVASDEDAANILRQLATRLPNASGPGQRTAKHVNSARELSAFANVPGDAPEFSNIMIQNISEQEYTPNETVKMNSELSCPNGMHKKVFAVPTELFGPRIKGDTDDKPPLLIKHIDIETDDEGGITFKVEGHCPGGSCEQAPTHGRLLVFSTCVRDETSMQHNIAAVY